MRTALFYVWGAVAAVELLAHLSGTCLYDIVTGETSQRRAMLPKVRRW